MKTFSEWKLLREELDIGQSMNNALMHVDNPHIFGGAVNSAMQVAQQTGNKQVMQLLQSLSGLPGAMSDAKRQGRDPNQLLDNARGTVRQIQSALNPEAAAFNAGRQGVGMTGHEATPVNTAAHQRGAQQYQANQQAMQQSRNFR